MILSRFVFMGPESCRGHIDIQSWHRHEADLRASTRRLPPAPGGGQPLHSLVRRISASAATPHRGLDALCAHRPTSASLRSGGILLRKYTRYLRNVLLQCCRLHAAAALRSGTHACIGSILCGLCGMHASPALPQSVARGGSRRCTFFSRANRPFTRAILSLQDGGP